MDPSAFLALEELTSTMTHAPELGRAALKAYDVMSSWLAIASVALPHVPCFDQFW